MVEGDTSPIDEVFEAFFAPGRRHRRTKHGPHHTLAARCVASEIEHCFGSAAPAAIASRLRELDVAVSAAQIESYQRGRYVPTRSMVRRIAGALQAVSIEEVHEWPWHLLADHAISRKAIERGFQLRPDGPRLEWLDEKKKQVHIHGLRASPIFFQSPNELLAPSDPHQFWNALAMFRLAELHRDVQEMNSYYMWVIQAVLSVAMHRAVAPHWPHLAFCLQSLSMRFPTTSGLQYSVDWQAIESVYEGRMKGHDIGYEQPFVDQDWGRNPIVGRRYRLVELE